MPFTAREQEDHDRLVRLEEQQVQQLKNQEDSRLRHHQLANIITGMQGTLARDLQDLKNAIEKRAEVADSLAQTVAARLDDEKEGVNPRLKTLEKERDDRKAVKKFFARIGIIVSGSIAAAFTLGDHIHKVIAWTGLAN